MSASDRLTEKSLVDKICVFLNNSYGGQADMSVLGSVDVVRKARLNGTLGPGLKGFLMRFPSRFQVDNHNWVTVVNRGSRVQETHLKHAEDDMANYDDWWSNNTSAAGTKTKATACQSQYPSMPKHTRAETMARRPTVATASARTTTRVGRQKVSSGVVQPMGMEEGMMGPTGHVGDYDHLSATYGMPRTTEPSQRKPVGNVASRGARSTLVSRGGPPRSHVGGLPRPKKGEPSPWEKARAMGYFPDANVTADLPTSMGGGRARSALDVGLGHTLSYGLQRDTVSLGTNSNSSFTYGSEGGNVHAVSKQEDMNGNGRVMKPVSNDFPDLSMGYGSLSGMDSPRPSEQQCVANGLQQNGEFATRCSSTASDLSRSTYRGQSDHAGSYTEDSGIVCDDLGDMDKLGSASTSVSGKSMQSGGGIDRTSVRVRHGVKMSLVTTEEVKASRLNDTASPTEGESGAIVPFEAQAEAHLRNVFMTGLGLPLVQHPGRRGCVLWGEENVSKFRLPQYGTLGVLMEDPPEPISVTWGGGELGSDGQPKEDVGENVVGGSCDVPADKGNGGNEGGGCGSGWNSSDSQKSVSDLPEDQKDGWNLPAEQKDGLEIGEDGDQASLGKPSEEVTDPEARDSPMQRADVEDALVPSSSMPDLDKPKTVFLNSHEPFCAVAVGIQGSGKSHSLLTIAENCMLHTPPVTQVPAPTATLVFHYDTDPSSVCEAVSLAVPNPDMFPVGMCAPCVQRVVVLVSPSYYFQRRDLYRFVPNCTVHPLLFNWDDLTAAHIKTLMKVDGQKDVEPLYMGVVLNILRCLQKSGNKPCWPEFREMLYDAGLQRQQGTPLGQRLRLLEALLVESDENKGAPHLVKLSDLVMKGTLVVADLTDPLLAPDEANSVFQVLLSQFLAAPTPNPKLAIFDEAHKYLDANNPNRDPLSCTIVQLVRQMRHYGMRIAISTQSPLTLPGELLELVSVALMHQFHSKKWFEYLHGRLALSPAAYEEVVRLKPGSALCFSTRWSSDVDSTGASACAYGHGVRKIRIRARMTSQSGMTKLSI